MSGPILLQGAMEGETRLFLAALAGGERVDVGGFPFWTGRIGPWDVVVSRTGMGYVNAAAATTLGIQRFHPSLVLNQGTAGAHREELTVGDMVVAEGCVPIHSVSAQPRARGAGSAPLSWEMKGITDGDSRGKPLVCPADEKWAARLMAAHYDGGKKILGILGSGDVFNREYDRILWLRERLGEDCEDMESFASCYLCRRMEIPWAGVRIISNNELTGQPYQPETEETLQRFLLGELGA